MLFPKYDCEKCKGTGVKELHSYHLGSQFSSLGFDLAIPLVIFAVPLYLLSFFTELGWAEFLHYWRVLAGIGALVFLLSIWFISPMTRKALYGKCVKCDGTGKTQKKDT